MSDHGMRVLVVHNRYRSAMPSGEDRVVDQETQLLSDAGYAVDLFERRSDDIASMSLLEKALVPVRVPWNAAVRRQLRTHLEATQPHIVHAHNTFPLLSPSVLAACSDVGVPVVASLHNYMLVCPTGTLTRGGATCAACAGKRLALPAIRHGCYRGSRLASVPMSANLLVKKRLWWSGVERFFCVSDAQRKVLVDCGVPSDRLTVKHHFVPEPGCRRASAGEYLLYVGRMAEEKGVRLLMEAWDSLDAMGRPGIPLLLVGDGPLSDEVRQWTARRSDASWVGLRSRAECAELMSRAAAVVAPSLAPETFGLVIAEAMAVGVPVVAARLGAYPELVVQGVTGVLHRPGSATSLSGCIVEILSDVRRNIAMGAAARSRYEERFNPAAGLAGLVEGYESARTSAITGVPT